MVAINQKKDINFGGNNSPDISLNSNLKRWFSRNIGLSHHIDLKTGFYKGRQVLDPKE